MVECEPTAELGPVVAVIARTFNVSGPASVDGATLPAAPSTAASALRTGSVLAFGAPERTRRSSFIGSGGSPAVMLAGNWWTEHGRRRRRDHRVDARFRTQAVDAEDFPLRARYPIRRTGLTRRVELCGRNPTGDDRFRSASAPAGRSRTCG